MTICMGYFNLHLDNSNEEKPDKFNEILTCFHLKQHVNFLILLNQIFRQQVFQTILRSYQKMTVVRRNGTRIKYRSGKINKIDYESYHSDIVISDLIKKPEKSLSALCQQYDLVLSSILDKHAPVSIKNLSGKPLTPWMTRSLSLQTSMPPVQ